MNTSRFVLPACLLSALLAPALAAQLTVAPEAYIKASNPGANDHFGGPMAMSGDTFVVGAGLEDGPATGVNGAQSQGAPNAGAVYVFVRTGAGWSQQAYVKASNTGAGDEFGTSVDIDGDTLVVGAPLEDSATAGVNGNQLDNSAPDAGAVYVFVRNGGTWTQQAYLKASNSNASDQFGASVAIDGDTIVVGANFEDSGASGVNGNPFDESLGGSGAAYVFVREGTSWSQQAYLKASNPDFNSNFAHRLALDGETIVVGALWEDSPSTGVNGSQSGLTAPSSGAAYVFVRSGTTWSQQAYLKASNTEALDNFSWSLAISGDTIVAGARGEDSAASGVNGDQAGNGAGNSGAAYVFVRDGGTWSQQAYLKASNPGPGDNFGDAVDLDGDILVLGARFEGSDATGVNGDQQNNGAPGSGAAYVLVREGTSWSQQAYLKHLLLDPVLAYRDDGFGHAVAVSGGAIAAGGHDEDSQGSGVNGIQNTNSLQESGAAWVFRIEGPSGPWNGLGFGLAGVQGVPLLIGTGTLVGGTPMSLTVMNATPQHSSLLVLGFSAIQAPFKGGVLVPAPSFVISGLATNVGGGFTTVTTCPVGLPSGFLMWMQVWTVDPSLPGSYSATNALKATTP